MSKPSVGRPSSVRFMDRQSTDRQSDEQLPTTGANLAMHPVAVPSTSTVISNNATMSLMTPSVATPMKGLVPLNEAPKHIKRLNGYNGGYESEDEQEIDLDKMLAPYRSLRKVNERDGSETSRSLVTMDSETAGISRGSRRNTPTASVADQRAKLTLDLFKPQNAHGQLNSMSVTSGTSMTARKVTDSLDSNDLAKATGATEQVDNSVMSLVISLYLLTYLLTDFENLSHFQHSEAEYTDCTITDISL